MSIDLDHVLIPKVTTPGDVSWGYNVAADAVETTVLFLKSQGYVLALKEDLKEAQA